MWAKASDCLCQAWGHMGKHAMGTKAVCYVWWVWSHLEEAPVRAGGLGGAGSQEEWQSRAKGINHFNGQGQIWCCLCWASQGEEELNKRKKQLCPPVVLSTERVPTYPCPFSKGFLCLLSWGWWEPIHLFWRVLSSLAKPSSLEKLSLEDNSGHCWFFLFSDIKAHVSPRWLQIQVVGGWKKVAVPSSVASLLVLLFLPPFPPPTFSVLCLLLWPWVGYKFIVSEGLHDMHKLWNIFAN